MSCDVKSSIKYCSSKDNTKSSGSSNKSTQGNINKRIPSAKDLLRSLKEAYSQFISQLIELFPAEGDLLQVKFFLESQISLESLMGGVIEYVLPKKNEINDENEKYFLDNMYNVFGSLPRDKVSHFRGLLNTLDHDNKKQVWQFFKVFVRLAENYLIVISANQKKSSN